MSSWIVLSATVSQRPRLANRRRRSSLFLLLVLAAALSLQLTRVDADEIRIAYNSQWYPYSYEEADAVRGILVELLDQIIGRQLGYQAVHKGYPWSRVQQNVADGHEDAFFTFPSEQRLAYADRAEVDVFRVESRAFVRKDSAMAARLATDEDITGVGDARICIMLGDNWSENFYRDRGLAFDYGRDTRNCLEQVAHNRADLFIHSSASSMATLRQLGLDDRVTMLPQIYSSVPLTLLVSKKGQVPSGFLQRFDQEVSRMAADGSLQALIDKLLSQSWPAPSLAN